MKFFNKNKEEYKSQDGVNVINLTPHTVNIIQEDMVELMVYESEGNARVSTESVCIGCLNGYTPIFKTKYGKVTGLPKEQEGTYYIVSMLVKQACQSRSDLLSPSQPCRDEQGRIIGCLGLE
ncbi:hypothetical protein DVV91_16935 [Clostridium botulinum]|uniref:hypothetical protein n=1 Tax=Clostridium botulinum TaxID=1491 RepID=UPI0019677E7A|nr:hypothetical protein [Clostridium botulinum]MBN1076008.1 hypothetical protein [Clostridium botulinum]